MCFPDSFRDMVRLLYTEPRLSMKVNGVVGAAFTPCNGVKQGCPLSPLLYIISLQPLLDSLEAPASPPPGLGIVISGRLGVGTTDVRCSAYADDVCLCLSSFAGLTAVSGVMADYHLAAGAATNWDKTVGLRLGSLRGCTPSQAELDAAGDLHQVGWRDVDSDEAERYLGIWLGSPAAVQQKWDERVRDRIEQRLHALRAAGLPASVYGRVIVSKVLLAGIAVFYVTNQTPRDYRMLVEKLSSDIWLLLWETETGQRRDAAGEARGRPPDCVRRSTCVQDHADGGCRALHVSNFFDALRTMWIRQLLCSPAPHPWKNIFWALGFDGLAPALTRLGERVLVSASTSNLVDFASGLPPPFDGAVRVWSGMPTPLPLSEASRVPTHTHLDADPPFEVVRSEPLTFNPAARTPGLTATEHVAFRRVQPTNDHERRLDTKRHEVQSELGHRGLVLIADVLPFIRITRQPAGSRLATVDAAALDAAHPRWRRGGAALAAIAAAWPQAWLRALEAGPRLFSEGEWVAFEHPHDGFTVGRVVNDQQPSAQSRFRVDVFSRDRSWTLHDEGRRAYCPSGCTARRCIVWRYEPPPESPDRANVVNPMTPRKHVPRHQRGGGWALCG